MDNLSRFPARRNFAKPGKSKRRLGQEQKKPENSTAGVGVPNN
jgi:hypothetical protein